MPRTTRGNRVPGSGKKPSLESLKLRELVIDILQKESPLSLYQLRQEVTRWIGPQGTSLKLAMMSLANSGDVIYERRNLRYGEYYAADFMRKNKSLAMSIEGKMLTPIDEAPYIRHVAAHQLPKLSGPIYLPMEWMVQQLQVS